MINSLKQEEGNERDETMGRNFDMLVDDYKCHAWILGLGPLGDFQPLEYFKQENIIRLYISLEIFLLPCEQY